MWKFLRRNPKPQLGWTDEGKAELASLIAEMLELQRSIVSAKDLEIDGQIKRKALGYVYGFTDAMLASSGLDMSNPEVGIPITYQVLRRLYPGKEQFYVSYLAENQRTDQTLIIGIMHGGQQYVEFSKPRSEFTPMGFARFLIDGDEAHPD